MTAQPRSLGEPETNQQSQDNRGYYQPRDKNQLDPRVASGRNVVVDVGVSVKESATVAKKIRTP